MEGPKLWEGIFSGHPRLSADHGQLYLDGFDRYEHFDGGFVILTPNPPRSKSSTRLKKVGRRIFGGTPEFLALMQP